uniref:Triphosphoribosyl-dephospho-CoA synthase n=1 Tax=Geoglobus ahangari TaxID=113653 RepID=A0A7C3YCS4_9EURY
MFENAVDAAIAAVSSLLLEVSSNPKPGNVDRDHNFPDLRYEHFIMSSVASYPIFLDIGMRKKSFGKGVLELVKNSMKWHKAKNVHFGAFLLLTPLVHSWGDVEEAKRFIEEADYRDSLLIKKAFDLSRARVMETKELSLKDRVEDEIVRKKIGVREWMEMAPKENFIAAELVNGYELSIRGSRLIFDYFERFRDPNKAIVLTFVTFLSELLDPLIIAKKGIKCAEKVRNLARSSLEFFKETENFAVFYELDSKILKIGVNPGSVADLVISSIYLSLSEGWIW